MIGSLTMEDLSRIRRMSPTDAESFLRGYALTEADRETAMKLAGKDLAPIDPIDMKAASVPRGQMYDATRPTWFVTAWLLGASWRQLAYLHKVTPQTVMASADKIMPSAERQAKRLESQMSYEALAEYRTAFIKGQWKGLDPLTIATTLIQKTELDR